MPAHSPFGAEVGGCDQTAQPYQFTGKYRDAESSLDDFGARFYQSNLGRFLSPDWNATPDTVPYANFGDPQSLNLYSYARNDPTTLTDPDGHLPAAGYTGGACKIDGADNGCGEPGVNGGGTVETDYPAMPDALVPHGWLYPPLAPPQPQTPDAAHQSAGQQAAVLAAYDVTCSHSRAGCTPDQAVKVRYVGFTFNVQIQGDPLDPATLGLSTWNDPKLFSMLFHGGDSVYLASGIALFGPNVGHVSASLGGIEGHIDHWGPWNPIHWGEAVLSTVVNTRRGAGAGVKETCSPAGWCH